MPVTIVKAGQQPKGSVSVQHKKTGATVEKEIAVGEPVVATGPMANVGFSASMTKNLGNYESVKVTVSLFLPCEPVPETIDKTFVTAKEWVDVQMQKTLEDLD